MASKKPKRKIDYLQLLTWLCRETKEEVPKDIDFYSDFQLMNLCNEKLIKLDALPFTFDELEQDLI